CGRNLLQRRFLQGMTLSAFVAHESHHGAIPSRTIVRLFFQLCGHSGAGNEGPACQWPVLQLAVTCSRFIWRCSKCACLWFYWLFAYCLHFGPPPSSFISVAA